MRQITGGLAVAALVALLVVPVSSASDPDAVNRVSIWTQGKGTVASVPVGISCPSRCIATFHEHQHVVFTAKPAKGWKFDEWYRGCTGKKPKCAIDLPDGGLTVAARFKR